MHRQDLIFGLRHARAGENLDCGAGFQTGSGSRWTLQLQRCLTWGLKCTLMKGSDMKTIRIYDRPMCCSTGICGPTVDPVLPRFAADLDTVRIAGHSVERYNLAQQPQAFVENKEIQSLISSNGTDVLPVVVIDGRVVSKGIYPSLEMLRMWTGSSAAPAAVPAATMSLPIADQGCCSGETGCC